MLWRERKHPQGQGECWSWGCPQFHTERYGWASLRLEGGRVFQAPQTAVAEALRCVCAVGKEQWGGQSGCRQELEERAAGDDMRQVAEGRAEAVEDIPGSYKSSEFHSEMWRHWIVLSRQLKWCDLTLKTSHSGGWHQNRQANGGGKETN